MITFDLAKEICTEPYKMLPFHLSEKSFRRYEVSIETVVNSYPTPVAFNPSPLSPNTYAARLRDAIASLIDNGWETSVNVDKLKSIRTQISVKINKTGNVVVQDKKDLSQVGQEVKTTTRSATKILKDVSEKELIAIVMLLSNGRIDPVKITGQNLATINLACVGYDVEFIEENDGVVLL